MNKMVLCTVVLTGNYKGGWSPKNVLPVSTIARVVVGTLFILQPVCTTVLTGNKKGGWSPQKVLPEKDGWSLK